jgi:rhodanese-related sulfurtransferase
MLILVALASGAMLLWPTLNRGGGAAALSVTEAVQAINREKAVMIDISEPDEFAAGHAPGSRSVPLASIEANNKNLPSNKALPLVVVCQTGSRASRAAALLKKQGYQDVRTLQGGLASWRGANLPVEKSA